MTPMQAIAAATVVAAEHMSVTRNVRRDRSRARFADLIATAESPLDDMSELSASPS